MAPFRRVRAVVVALGALALGTAGCAATAPDPAASPVPAQSASPEPSAAPPAPQEPSTVATGLDAPWSVAFAGDIPLVALRDSAEIVELSADGSSRVVGAVEGVEPRSEAGLLGLAVDDEQRLYVFAVGADSSRIERYELDGEPGSYALGAREVVLDGIPAGGFHAGGRIAFGPDGMLYATVGDTGDPASAQDPDSLAGKILRMTADGDVPDDNPFGGSLVYSLGHRNPQGLAWAADGTMFASEFGQDTWDELNIIAPGGNYGWPVVEGAADDDRFVDPVQQWAPADASPSGIAVIDDVIYVANLRGERLRSVPVAEPSSAEELFVGEHGRLRDVVGAPDGSIWIVTNNTDGRGQPRDGDDRIIRFTP